jgi:hypothetical protein
MEEVVMSAVSFQKLIAEDDTSRTEVEYARKIAARLTNKKSTEKSVLVLFFLQAGVVSPR